MHEVSLMETKCMSYETSSELSRVLDSYPQRVNTLENLGRPVMHWDNVLVFYLLKNLTHQLDWKASPTSSVVGPLIF